MGIDKILNDVVLFEKNFYFIKDKRIVLYGLGRNTERLLSNLKGFNIVGLMDGNPDKIGTIQMGIPCISVEDAEQKADCIIINTIENYWYIIYERLEKCSLPVYFKNGERAHFIYKSPDREQMKALAETDEEDRVVDLLYSHLPEDGIFSDWRNWGYCLWGPVVWAYLSWLYRETLCSCECLFFLARDGYMLYEDYYYFLKIMQIKNPLPAYYVASSRRLTYVSAVHDEKSYVELISDVYSGYFKNYMKTRLGIEVNGDANSNKRIEMPRDLDTILDWIKPYEKKIREIILQERAEYIKYLHSISTAKSIGIVDTGVTGKMVYCLQNLLGTKDVKGYFFYGNMQPQNPYKQYFNMCFQSREDLNSELVNLWKHYLIVETIFTAPQGMAVKMENSKIIYEEIESDFTKNEIINEGIKEFLSDARTYKFGREGVKSKFIDAIFGYLMKNTSLELSLQKELVFLDKWAG